MKSVFGLPRAQAQRNKRVAMNHCLQRIKLMVVVVAILVAAVLASGCRRSDQQSKSEQTEQGLVGAWRARVQFKDGAFSEVKDIEFMYVFNAGGTMTESSNYDAIPPVPPAYGVWRRIGPNKYEAKYEYYATRVPDTSEHLAVGSGWLPAGRGVLLETITVASDGKSFTSKIRYDAFDQSGKSVEGGGDAIGKGISLKF